MTEDGAKLIAMLIEGSRRTARRAATALGMIALLFCGVAAVAIAVGVHGAAVFFGGIGAGVAALGVSVYRRRTGRSHPVLDVLRAAPDQIVAVRRRGFTHRGTVEWLEIKTTDQVFDTELRDLPGVYEQLKKRCPNATFG